MHFIVKTIGSTVLGLADNWLGGFAGTGAGFLVGFVFSIIGWYGAGYLFNAYLD